MYYKSMLWLGLMIVLFSYCEQEEMKFECADIDFNFIQKPTEKSFDFKAPEFEIEICRGYTNELSYQVQAYYMIFGKCVQYGTYIKTDINEKENSEDAIFIQRGAFVEGVPVKYFVTVSCASGRVWEKVYYDSF